NYTNVCVTDCDFCAFYRRPGERGEAYLLPKPVIFKKIEETLALGGTGLLMQGGHHPDLGIEYYEDLFRSIKQRYRIHLHALSPPEVQHISRRSKLTIPETLTRLRDAGLDSIPGGGGEVLVDRVRDNMPHIGSSWVTQGKKIGQVALGFGADDLGSVMIEENVVSAAGTTHRTSAEELAHLIRAIGKTPVQRDTLYRDVKVWN